MTKIVLMFFLMGIISCAEKKQQPNNNSDQEINHPNQTSQIEFESEMHDFGKVKSGEKLVYSFVFTNRGKADLKVIKAEADCECITAGFPASAIKTKERGIIEVKFNSAGMIGKQLKTVEIQSNSKEPKHLIIFADVENEQIEFKY